MTRCFLSAQECDSQLEATTEIPRHVQKFHTKRMKRDEMREPKDDEYHDESSNDGVNLIHKRICREE